MLTKEEIFKKIREMAELSSEITEIELKPDPSESYSFVIEFKFSTYSQGKRKYWILKFEELIENSGFECTKIEKTSGVIDYYRIYFWYPEGQTGSKPKEPTLSVKKGDKVETKDNRVGTIVKYPSNSEISLEMENEIVIINKLDILRIIND